MKHGIQLKSWELFFMFYGKQTFDKSFEDWKKVHICNY